VFGTTSIPAASTFSVFLRTCQMICTNSDLRTNIDLTASTLTAAPCVALET